jgi:hypothetical protein
VTFQSLSSTLACTHFRLPASFGFLRNAKSSNIAFTHFSLAHAAGDLICSPMSQAPVWFILVDSDGLPYEGTAASTVNVDLEANIPVLRKAIKVECEEILDNISPLRFQVYKNRDVFDSQGKPLREDSTIAGLGTSLDDALVIVIQPSRKSSSAPGGLISAQYLFAFLCIC